MKFHLGRYGIEITPETPADVAYIEDTLGLNKNGDSIPLVRHGCIGSFQMAHLSTPSAGHERDKWICETHGAWAARLVALEEDDEGDLTGP